jgi:hypothetical protein
MKTPGTGWNRLEQAKNGLPVPGKYLFLQAQMGVEQDGTGNYLLISA